MADDSQHPVTRPGSPERETADQRLGLNVRTLRERKGLSQRAVADEMRSRGHPWHQQTVLKAEAGTRPLRFAEAVDLAAILETSLDRLTWASPEANAVEWLVSREARLRQSARQVSEAVTRFLLDRDAAGRSLTEAAHQSPRVEAEREEVRATLAGTSLDYAVGEGIARYEELTGGSSEEASS